MRFMLWNAFSASGFHSTRTFFLLMRLVSGVMKCASFSHNSKKSHEIGVKHIDRYLQGTKDTGLILAPDARKLQLDLYADADFTGLFATEDEHDLVSVKSRTRVLLIFRGVLIYWGSKLQFKIALFTQ